MNNKQQYRFDNLATLLVLSITLVSCNTANLGSTAANTRPDPQEIPAQQDKAQWPHQTAINIAMAVTGHPVATEPATVEPVAEKTVTTPTVAETVTAPPPVEKDLWARLRSG